MPEPIAGDDKRAEVIAKIKELANDDEKSGGKFINYGNMGSRR